MVSFSLCLGSSTFFLLILPMQKFNPAVQKESAAVNGSLVYPSGKIEVVSTRLTAAEFIQSESIPDDVKISTFNALFSDFATSKNIQHIKSLDLRCLGLTDQHISQIFSTAKFESLVWLDLSCNPDITEVGVRAICESIKNGSLGRLDWLNLLGTECDATPYIDGHYWRISGYAKKLAEEFGYQQWMMLGSRDPALEHDEVLTTQQREFSTGQYRIS
jgi:hypothetical protein